VEKLGVTQGYDELQNKKTSSKLRWKFPKAIPSRNENVFKNAEKMFNFAMEAHLCRSQVLRFAMQPRMG